ncbi:hypothetical protein [Trinickia sp. Y13]|uniref:hypothetical protein n=1 Tax=Trinickia sp. Y13 TaxID=2917807 RepID=UPI002406233E|nr:hypothetical protein [Trinickia sp. Y13]MDG0024933.1 hypothetical protein [Trinickia sp. Y13]
MTPTKSLAIALALGALTAGLLAAWFWERTTRVRVDLFASDPYAMPAAGTDIADPMWWTAQFRAEREIGRLNTLAARWTAAAVLLGTLSSVVGLF